VRRRIGKVCNKGEEKGSWKKVSFFFSEDLYFDFSEVLAGGFIGSGEAFDFSKMSFQSFGVFVEIECFVVLDGFEFFFMVETGNKVHDFLALFILDVEVIVFDKVRSVLNLSLDAFKFEILL
jgi:hypothetical protein